MTKTDKYHIENYIKGGLRNNLITAMALKKALSEEKDVINKKILYIRIFYELIQIMETVISLLYIIRHYKRIKGFWKNFIRTEICVKDICELWQEIKRYKNREYLYFTKVLKLNVPKKMFIKENDVYIWLFKGIYIALENRTKKGTIKKSGKLIRCYNRIKHGFTLELNENLEPILFYVRAGKKGITKIPLSYKESEVDKWVNSIKAHSITIVNLLNLLIYRGYNGPNTMKILKQLELVKIDKSLCLTQKNSYKKH